MPAIRLPRARRDRYSSGQPESEGSQSWRPASDLQASWPGRPDVSMVRDGHARDMPGTDSQRNQCSSSMRRWSAVRPAAGTLAMTTGYPSPGRACASAPWPSRLPKRKLRVLSFVTRDKFQHRRLATLHCGEAALEGRDNLLRIGDFFTVRAHGLCHL